MVQITMTVVKKRVHFTAIAKVGKQKNVFEGWLEEIGISVEEAKHLVLKRVGEHNNWDPFYIVEKTEAL